MWHLCAAQVFPTRVRALGLGVCNVMSRIGALLSPFLTVDLVVRGYPAIAEVAIGGACLAAAVATAALPLETSGKALMVRPCRTLIRRVPELPETVQLWQACAFERRPTCAAKQCPLQQGSYCMDACLS
jgi:hypothetical protein